MYPIKGLLSLPLAALLLLHPFNAWGEGDNRVKGQATLKSGVSDVGPTQGLTLGIIDRNTGLGAVGSTYLGWNGSGDRQTRFVLDAKAPIIPLIEEEHLPVGVVVVPARVSGDLSLVLPAGSHASPFLDRSYGLLTSGANMTMGTANELLAFRFSAEMAGGGGAALAQQKISPLGGAQYSAVASCVVGLSEHLQLEANAGAKVFLNLASQVGKIDFIFGAQGGLDLGYAVSDTQKISAGIEASVSKFDIGNPNDGPKSPEVPSAKFLGGQITWVY
ncbi:hypothetical protein WDW37_11985 [Bdellovibrionota bacterium FG-1]